MRYQLELYDKDTSECYQVHYFYDEQTLLDFIEKQNIASSDEIKYEIHEISDNIITISKVKDNMKVNLQEATYLKKHVKVGDMVYITGDIRTSLFSRSYYAIIKKITKQGKSINLDLDYIADNEGIFRKIYEPLDVIKELQVCTYKYFDRRINEQENNIKKLEFETNKNIKTLEKALQNAKVQCNDTVSKLKTLQSKVPKEI